MSARKIVEWPKYRKTGSPTEKQRRQMQHVMDHIFAELLPLTGGGKRKGATAPLLRAPTSAPSRGKDEERASF